MLLLLLLLCHHTSQQEQDLPPGRCDAPRRNDMYTPCTSWAACAFNTCPHGYMSVGTANCIYTVQIGGRIEILAGCQHQCVRSVMEPQCCPSFWGSLCLPCPSWSGQVCNNHGSCMEGLAGNGTCVCDEGFSGFACQECTNPNFYGEKCNKECNCHNGVCNNGPDGNGQCLCQPPYSGTRCDRVSSRCSNCSPYSYCKGEGDSAYCDCLPGYRQTQQGKCIKVCSARDCDVNAACSTQGSKLSCACKPGYEGDGRICVPKNPCTKNNGGCPLNSTYCVFEGPDKSSCKCNVGMSPVGGNAELGCQLVSACSANTCDSSARCYTERSGQASCVCRATEIGDGRRCYSDLMERLLELDSSGTQTGQLTGAVTLFDKGCSSLLSNGGPFTAFIPVLKTPLTDVDEAAVCRNHLILGEHLSKSLEGQDYNMHGGAVMRTKGNNRFILMDDPSRQYTIVQADLPAANGVIHIIDQPIVKTLSGRSLRDEQFADKTIGEILTKDDKFNRFLSLVDNCGDPPPLRGPGPLTVFIPTNDAVDRARDGSILYMLNDAKHKLQELLRHHVYSQAALSVDDLATLHRIHTMANQVVSVTVSNTGQILLGDKLVHLASTNIVASNGIIHMIDGLLYPPSILPILPKHCDVVDSKIIMGPCTHCSYLHNTRCPDGTVEMIGHTSSCTYTEPPHTSVQSGCAKYCNATRQIAECCKGFYGPDCKPCIGGFQHPCYDRGMCLDGIHGNGSCSCRPGFKGIACHICEDPNKHGDHCDEECHCVHGVCDNRPGSGGVCRKGSCQEGFSGDLCDKTAKFCNADWLHIDCHIHAVCVLVGPLLTCACKNGYEGDGHSCTLTNPCLTSNRGGCDLNAECVFGGPGNVSCVCAEGWIGDGLVCLELNNCQLDTRGGCSPNAHCIHVGPGNNKCVCKTGFMGDGKVCDRVNPCTVNYGGCHQLAKCDFNDTTHTCTCPDGYSGNGTLCYGSLTDELEWNPDILYFHRFIMRGISVSLNLSGELTLLAPSLEASRNMSIDQQLFWRSRHRIQYFLRAFFLLKVYTVEELSNQIGKKLPTLNPNLFWEVSNSSKGIRIGNATIVTPNLPATNGIIHIIDQVMIPPLSDLPPEPPSLMAFLNSSSNFTLFRQYAQMYNFSAEPGLKHDYTILAPTDDAIREHLSKANKTVLDIDEFKYHVIFGDLLFPHWLHDGLFKATFLGSEYEIQFSIIDDNQTFANDVPLNGTVIETEYGIILPIPQVLRIQRNRCNNYVTVLASGRCTDCDEAPRCLFGTKPTKAQFPANMKPNCRYRKRVGSRRKSVPGCVIKCLRQLPAHACCPGFYGHECFKCPGDIGSWCSNHGQCQDGTEGNGECRCYEGFHGTACEDCEPGRYGVNCTKKCACAHGKCEDGLAGSGKCVCYKGWKGAVCSQEIKDDACGGNCDENANCVSGPNGSAATCVCVAGYKGNGTSCKELDLCHWSNGGCSENAVCTKVSAGERTCTCREGYTGDGVVCLEMNPCHDNNGGCHVNAECIKIGQRTRCRCLPGFQGTGFDCVPGNPCVHNNGGCSKYARCLYTGRGKRNCSCRTGHVGDGIECRGSTYWELQREPESGFFSRMYSRSSCRGLLGDGPFTVFVPSAEINDDSAFEAWNRVGRLADLVRYHIVSCETLSLNDLKTTNMVVSTSGHTLQLTVNQHSVWINNSSRIVKSDHATANGVIHYVDKLLTPYTLQNVAPSQSDKMNLTRAAQFYGYTRFYKMVEAAGLIPVLEMKIHKPFTMLWPTDKVLDSLPASRQQWLFSPDHQQELASIVKAHIIRNTMLKAATQPGKYSKYRSMLGSYINFNCDKNLVGAVLINDNEARIVERYMVFQDGLAYGIDQLLEPPGLGAHCDSLVNRTIYGRCGSCLTPPDCRSSHKDTRNTESCSRPSRFSSYRRSYALDSWYNHMELSSRARGCRRICQYEAWDMKCCKNHYGRDCAVCPGGLEAPCNYHGNCSDGLFGSGKCVCHTGFSGDACELCLEGFYGPNCTVCECERMGRCDDGIDGSGECTCTPGWKGKRCEIDIGSIPEECRQCHSQADCLLGIGCLCKPGFQGNGTYCSLEPPPDLCSNYNGGCHHHADCNQTGLIVNCTCHTNYNGDGFSCEPVNRCTEEVNGGCSDFASCKFTGPNERECNCLPGFVGNGIQCLEKVVPPVDRCLEENGGCHDVATCKDLHYHANTAGVFHLRSPAGKYKMNFSEADSACQAEGATLASFKQLGDAQQLGMHLCVAGWMEGGKVGYPTRFPSVKCGDNHVGLVMYREPVDQSSKYDAYCYRINDVSCVCPAGYVGNGDFCNGVLTSVLATNSNFSMFYKLLLDYSSSSSEGRRLMDILLHQTSEVMLFVPHNFGFTQNKTLSERDIEYHFSANHSIRPFKELHHKEVITSRLGFNLTVTQGDKENSKMVNQRLLLDWDIPALNGIIHVIEAPLTAPPMLVPAHHTTRGHAHSSSAVSAILVTVLLACVFAALGYYVFKHKTDAFRFHYFRNDDEDNPTGGRKKPTVVSIPNPLYSGSRAFAEPFGDNSQEMEQTEAEEPSKILDLD